MGWVIFGVNALFLVVNCFLIWRMRKHEQTQELKLKTVLKTPESRVRLRMTGELAYTCVCGTRTTLFLHEEPKCTIDEATT